MVSDFEYALLSSVYMERTQGGLSKRKCVYDLYLYKKAGLDFRAIFSMNPNGLGSSQVCQKLDELVNLELVRADTGGKYYLTEKGEQYLSGYITSVYRWGILERLEYYLQYTDIKDIHFQAIVYLVLTDAGYSADDLCEKQEDITKILKTLLQDYSDKKFQNAVKHINKYFNKLSKE